VNGVRKYSGQVVGAGKKRACQVERIRPILHQGTIKEDRSGATVPGESP
jgi:hypothetical protein